MHVFPHAFRSIIYKTTEIGDGQLSLRIIKTLTSRDMKQAFGGFVIVVLVCQSLCERPRHHMAQNTLYVGAKLTLYSRNKLPVVYQSLPVNSDTLDSKI